MKLTFRQNHFVFECTYEEYKSTGTPKDQGFRWNPKEKEWYTESIEKAMKLIQYADDTIKPAIELKKKKMEENITASQAATSDLQIPAPKGLNYFPFQKAGIAYAQDKKSVLIADEMGLGKTIQAIGLINLNPDLKKILIIVPNTLKLNWKRELNTWLIRQYNIQVLSSTDQFPIEYDILIINYDILEKFYSNLISFEWDLIILDECHYIKGYKSQRSILVRGGQYEKKERGKKGKIKCNAEGIKAKKKILLTGTPILNRPIDLFPILSYMQPWYWKNVYAFGYRYCAAKRTKWGLDMTGASNLEELQAKLRDGLMVRRLKKYVLKELPAKIRQVIELPANGNAGLVQQENVAWDKWRQAIEELRMAVERAKMSDNDQDYQLAVDKLKEEASVAFSEMAKIRHQVAVSKIPYCIEHLNNILEEKDKIVVMAHHHDVVDALKKEFGDQAVVLTGRETIEQKQKAVDEFQNNPTIKLFIGSITAAGVGITLTKASIVVFVELDWVPANITQAEDRCHRIGQINSVLIQHLVMEGSIDVNMAKKIVEKQRVIEKAMDSPVSTDWLEQIPVLPKSEVEEMATIKKSKRNVDHIAKQLTPEQIGIILTAIQMIAGMCDGAQAIDGHGFNKFDARIGKELAVLKALSRKQAAFGYYLMRKYRKQLPESMVFDLKEKDGE